MRRARDIRSGDLPPERRPEGRPARPGVRAALRLALAALLLAHALLAVDTLRRSSVTLDEFAHLPAGLSYWQQGRFALYHHNPPLVKMLAALPVLASRPFTRYAWPHDVDPSGEPPEDGGAGGRDARSAGAWERARAGLHGPWHVELAATFMRDNAAQYFDMFGRARCAIVALSILGACLVYLWGRDLWGAGAGLLAAALWCLEPNLIAHAGLVTTDLGAAVAMLGATYACWRYLRRPTWAGAVAFGITLGAAQLVKFSALILYLVFPAMVACRRLAVRRAASAGSAPCPPSGNPPTGGAPIAAFETRGPRGAWLLIPALSLFVLNLGYGFEGTGRPLGSFAFLSPDLTRPRSGGTPPDHPSAFYRRLYAERQNRFEGTWLERLPVPLPAHYVLGFDEQRFESNLGLPGGGYAVYLRGEIRRAGWWYYDLYALAVKVPVAWWFLAASALAAAFILPGYRAAWPDEVAWALPAAAYLALMSLLTGVDLGVRYDLPVLPFLCVGASRLVRALANRGPAPPGGLGPGAAGHSPRRWLATSALAVGLAWLFLGTLRVHPHELSYFNELAGGPAGGHRHLLDSNLDWGQDLLRLAGWLRSHPREAPIALAYFGAVDPRLAGIDYRVPPRDPGSVPQGWLLPGEADALRPGTYAVSVNFVQGLPHRLLSPDGQVVPVDRDAYGYFRALSPAARAGYSIWIYRLGEEDVVRIRARWAEAATGGRR